LRITKYKCKPREEERRRGAMSKAMQIAKIPHHIWLGKAAAPKTAKTTGVDF
jgi:hypothetical protein